MLLTLTVSAFLSVHKQKCSDDNLWFTGSGLLKLLLLMYCFYYAECVETDVQSHMQNPSSLILAEELESMKWEEYDVLMEERRE